MPNKIRLGFTFYKMVLALMLADNTIALDKTPRIKFAQNNLRVLFGNI
jgi:hypothetical protein